MAPKMSAPTDLSMSVMVMPCKSWKQSVSCVVQFPRVCKCEYQQQLTQVTSEFSMPNSFATSVTVNDTVAKSKESHILQSERRTQHQHLAQRATKESSPRACKFSRGDSPSQETGPKHEPLMRIKLPQDSNGILHLSPRKPEGSHSSGYVVAHLGGGGRTALQPCYYASCLSRRRLDDPGGRLCGVWLG
jgi:hypothetical protein